MRTYPAFPGGGVGTPSRIARSLLMLPFLASACVLLFAACGGGGFDEPGGFDEGLPEDVALPDTSDDPLLSAGIESRLPKDSEAAKSADMIVGAEDGGEALETTIDALALAGLTVVTGENEDGDQTRGPGAYGKLASSEGGQVGAGVASSGPSVLAEATSPAASEQLTVTQAAGLALEGIGRENSFHMTGDQLATLFADITSAYEAENGTDTGVGVEDDPYGDPDYVEPDYSDPYYDPSLDPDFECPEEFIVYDGCNTAVCSEFDGPKCEDYLDYLGDGSGGNSGTEYGYGGGAGGFDIIAFIPAWVNAAIESPDDPEAFNALLFAELAMRQDPPVDVSTWFEPSQLQLTLLDLTLLLAAFDRGLPDWSVSNLGGERYVLAGAAVQDPCSKLKDMAGKWGQAAEAGVQAGSNVLVDKAIAGAGINGNLGSGTLLALSALAHIRNMILFYGVVNTSVVSNADNPMHKPVGGGAEEVTFTAYVDTSASDSVREYLEQANVAGNSEAEMAAADCLRTVGLPVAKDLETLAKEAEEWQVRWSMSGAGGSYSMQIPPDQHATIDVTASKFDGSQILTHKMRTRNGFVRTTSDLVVDVQPEPEQVHTDENLQAQANVTIYTEVLASQPPSIANFATAMMGPWNLVGSVLEIIVEGFKAFSPPKSSYNLVIEYHLEDCVCVDNQPPDQVRAGWGEAR